MSSEELFHVMGAIGSGDDSDLAPVKLDAPDRKVHVDFPEPLSRQFQKYVHEQMRDHTILRVFKRFRVLAMACAVLDGRESVHARDVEKVASFDVYWKRMVKG